MKKTMNKITNWTYDKPTEPGLYLVCHGDIEVAENMEPYEVIESSFDLRLDGGKTWPQASIEEIETWSSGYKYARLVFGSEARCQ